MQNNVTPLEHCAVNLLPAGTIEAAAFASPSHDRWRFLK